MTTQNEHYMTSFQFISFYYAFINKHFQERITVHGPEKLSIKILLDFLLR